MPLRPDDTTDQIRRPRGTLAADRGIDDRGIGGPLYAENRPRKKKSPRDVGASDPNRKTASDARSESRSEGPRLRLILHADSLEKSGRHTFEGAAQTLKLDYKKHYPGDRVFVFFVRTGAEIAAVINACVDRSIVSLDIASHGNQGGVHISRKLPKPIPSSLLQGGSHYLARRNSAKPQSVADATMIEESMHGLYTDPTAQVVVAAYFNQQIGDGCAYLSTVNFKKFADNAFVEFHGCRTAEYVPYLTALKSNFAASFSAQMPPGGAAVGHIESAAPDEKPTAKDNDYRHGKVRMYVGGRLSGSGPVERSHARWKDSSTPPTR